MDNIEYLKTLNGGKRVAIIFLSSNCKAVSSLIDPEDQKTISSEDCLEFLNLS